MIYSAEKPPSARSSPHGSEAAGFFCYFFDGELYELPEKSYLCYNRILPPAGAASVRGPDTGRTATLKLLAVMKKLLLLLSVVLTACRAERVVQDPLVDRSSENLVTVAQIVVARDSTVVDLELRNAPGCWVRLSSGTVLRGCTTGTEYALRRAEGFPLDEKVTIDKMGIRHARLIFEPVSRRDRTVDLIEPGKDGCRMEGIHLEAVRPPAGKVCCHIEGEVVDRPQSSLLLLYAFTESGSHMSEPVARIPIRGGRFACDLYLDAPDCYDMAFADEELRGSWMQIRFIAAEGDVRMTLYPYGEALEKNRIEGGALNDEWSAYLLRKRRLSEPYERAMGALYESGTALTPQAQRLLDKMMDRHAAETESRKASRKYMELIRSGEAYRPEFRALMEEQRSVQRGYLDSLLAGEPTLPRLALLADQLRRFAVEPADVRLFEERYAAVFADHPLTRFCSERISAAQVREGAPYIDFTAPDLSGAEQRVSELVAGKRLFLLDFWASWCGPCRRSAKALIPIYEKYADRGFTVVGIARECYSTDALLKAVEKDGYPWVNLVELDDRSGLWARYGRYNVAGFQVLIDDEGRIVRFDPEPDELERLLAERLAE